MGAPWIVLTYYGENKKETALSDYVKLRVLITACFCGLLAIARRSSQIESPDDRIHLYLRAITIAVGLFVARVCPFASGGRWWSASVKAEQTTSAGRSTDVRSCGIFICGYIHFANVSV